LDLPACSYCYVHLPFIVMLAFKALNSITTFERSVANAVATGRYCWSTKKLR
jgi:hypothetical protein